MAICNTLRLPISAAFSTMILLSTHLNAENTNLKSFEQDLVFSPDQWQINAEQRGRVCIVNKLDEDDVDRLIDQQFDRIEHFLLVNIQYRDETESNDECD